MSTLAAQRHDLTHAIQRCGVIAEYSAHVAENARGVDNCSRKCRDVASLCRIAGELLVRRSAFEHGMLLICVLAAEDCARECEAHPGGFFADCARSCRALSEAASEFSGDTFDSWFDLSGGRVPMGAGWHAEPSATEYHS
jgi:hypothetical protein